MGKIAYYQVIPADRQRSASAPIAFSNATPTALEAIRSREVLSYQFNGTDQVFDGTRIVKKGEEDIAKLRTLNQGSIIIKYQPDSAQTDTRGTLFSVRQSSVTMTSETSNDNNDIGIYAEKIGGSIGEQCH